VRGDGINNFDFSVFKNFAGIPLPKAKEGGTLQLRFEFYNLFNHTQFNIYGTGAPISFQTISGVTQSVRSLDQTTHMPTNNFGQATNARLPRQIQLGIKLYF
jgi:hypothetical protein